MELSRIIDDGLRRVIRARSFPGDLQDAMLYAAKGGKKLRGTVVIRTADHFGVKLEKALPAALSVEMIHTYSLVHDDLPSMDDDDMRRGRPSLHKAFGEGLAVLGGDALLTMAFQVLSDASGLEDGEKAGCLNVLARESGALGMAGGQSLDLQYQKYGAAEREIREMYLLKTGALFGASAKIGGVLAGSSYDTQKDLYSWGKSFGLAFQVADDMDDLPHEGMFSCENAKGFAEDAFASAFKSLESSGLKGSFLWELTVLYAKKTGCEEVVSAIEGLKKRL